MSAGAPYTQVVESAGYAPVVERLAPVAAKTTAPQVDHPAGDAPLVMETVRATQYAPVVETVHATTATIAGQVHPAGDSVGERVVPLTSETNVVQTGSISSVLDTSGPPTMSAGAPYTQVVESAGYAPVVERLAPVAAKTTAPQVDHPAGDAPLVTETVRATQYAPVVETVHVTTAPIAGQVTTSSQKKGAGTTYKEKREVKRQAKAAGEAVSSAAGSEVQTREHLYETSSDSVYDAPSSMDSWSSTSSSEDEAGVKHHHRLVHHHEAKPKAEAPEPAPIYKPKVVTKFEKRAEKIGQKAQSYQLPQHPEEKVKVEQKVQALMIKADGYRQKADKLAQQNRLQAEREKAALVVVRERAQAELLRDKEERKRARDEKRVQELKNNQKEDEARQVAAKSEAEREKLKTSAAKAERNHHMATVDLGILKGMDLPRGPSLPPLTVVTNKPMAEMVEPLLAKRLNEDKFLFPSLVAEFTGTFILVWTIGNAVQGDCLHAAAAIACALMAGVYVMGHISGGHLNPAVTFFLALSKSFPWEKVGYYWLAQLCGGLVAALLFRLLLGPVAVGPRLGYAWSSACVAEALYTCMLCFVFGACAASKKNNPADDGNQFFGLAIGFVIIAGGFAVGGISGAFFNPAVALSLGITGSSFWWGITYVLFELSGAAIAYVLYSCARTFKEWHCEATWPSKLLSEFLGTFMLVVTVCLNLQTGSKSTAFSAAAAYMCMIYSLGTISGAHFNPAVTLAVVMSGRDKMPYGPVPASYILVQMLGGVLAGSLAHCFCPYEYDVIKVQPGAEATWTMACGVELMFTFVLCFVVLAVGTTKPSSPSAQVWQLGLAIGSCVTAGGLAIGWISGGYLNPAVTFGADFLAMGFGASDTHFYALWYGIFQLLGGALAAMVFRFLTHRTDKGELSELSPYIAELLGTLVLTFTVSCIARGPGNDWGVTGIACSFMVMIYALGGVSGAHLNPAVTFFKCMVDSKRDTQAGLKYWGMQMLGGLLGATLSMKAMGRSTDDVTMLAPIAPYSWVGAGFVETLFTCMLCFVVGCVAISEKDNSKYDANGYFGLAIGFVIVAGGYGSGGISGFACFNPAVAAGLAWTGPGGAFGGGWYWALVWALFEFSGASFAAILYFLIRSPSADGEPTINKQLLSEFFGTFLLCMTVGLNVATGSNMTAWSAAAALTCMIYSLGSVSGAHLNPAVTAAVWVYRHARVPRKSTPPLGFFSVQCLAGLISGLTTRALLQDGTECKLKANLAGFISELIFTAILVLVVLGVVAPNTQWHHPSPTTHNNIFGLVIGMCMMVSLGAVSGGVLNPALGFMFASSCGLGWSLATFALAEVAGGVLVAMLFMWMWDDDFYKKEQQAHPYTQSGYEDSPTKSPMRPFTNKGFASQRSALVSPLVNV